MDTTTQTMRQLPRYKCHKEVWALKIKSISKANPPTIKELEKILNSESDTPVSIQPDGSLSAAGAQQEEVVGAIIVPEDEGYGEFPVSRAYIIKHNPQPGGYFVVYDDGYRSYSPAAAFESGYTLKQKDEVQTCGQQERDARLLEGINNPEIIYYGPHPCDLCDHGPIIRGSMEQGFGDLRFDFPVMGFIYPNHNWTLHRCTPKEG